MKNINVKTANNKMVDFKTENKGLTNSGITKVIFKRIIYYFFTICVALVFVMPLWMVFINSFKAKVEAKKFGIGFPDVWMTENYQVVFEEAKVFQAFGNGLIISVGSVLLILICSSLAAFSIARSRQKWANMFYYIFLCGLVIPVAFIPTYLVLNKLDLLDTYLGLILISATYGLPMSIFLYTGFIKTIPRELDEAAMLDGCGPTRFLLQIMIPLLKPVTVTLLIFNFVGSWNDIQVPLYFSTSDKWGLPLTVYNFYGAYASSWNLIFADIVITVLPLLILYLIGQKHIISGMTAGAVKS